MSAQRFTSIFTALWLAGCATAPPSREATSAAVPSAPAADELAAPRLSEHRGDDDLLSAGLGLDGLRLATPPPLADAAAPTATELRRRAIWANWRGIADLSPSGYGQAYGAVPPVHGIELNTLLRLPGAQQPFRALLQIPDGFDPRRPCVVSSASSGSRGIYGAIALAGGWALPRGCAVLYTDKGAGTDWIAPGATASVGLDGRLDPAVPAAFTLPAAAQSVAFKHAHSEDHPEAHWGKHVRASTRWALAQLDRRFPAQAPFAAERTRLIAVGVSNGAGAVLQAAGLADFGLDAVVAISPNVLPGEGGRPLYDYATEAALWMPCALQSSAYANTPLARPGVGGELRCAALQRHGLIEAGSLPEQAEAARRHLLAQGWSEPAIEAGALSVAFDLWRAVAAAYASAYTRRSADDMICGYRYAAVDASGAPRAVSAIEPTLWWSDSSGIPPIAGVALLNPPSTDADPAFDGLRCLRALWEQSTPEARQLQAAIAETRVGKPRPGLPIRLIHGDADGLVPAAFSARAYAGWLGAGTAGLITQWVTDAQHFDAFVALPAWQGRYRALMPEAYAALDALWSELDAVR